MEGFGKHELRLSLSLSRVRFLLKRLVSSQFVDSFRTTKLDVSLLKKLKTTLMKLQVIFEQLITYKHAAKHWPNLNSFYNNIDGLLFDEIDTEAVRCKVEATTGTSNSHFKRLTYYRLQQLIDGLEFTTSTTSYDLADETSMQLPSLLTSSVKVLSDRLDSTDFINNFGRTKLDVSLLENLKKTVLHLEYRLGYTFTFTYFIEGRWLDMLRNAVFEVVYFFDQINPEALQSRPSTSQVLKNLSSPFKLFNGVTNFEFQKLIERLEFLTSRAWGEFYSSRSESVLHETPTSSILDDESSFYGRDTDVKKLKHLLLSPDCGDSKIGIISIVGIEGIGKTTLAKLLYNDPEVYNKFEVRVWAHVSNHFADLIVLETILDDLNENRNDTGDGVNTIYLKLLLVLDELRDARSIRTLLLKILHVVEKGSRIIITTQDERVALSVETFVSSMQTSLSVNYLRPLEIEDSWSLLARHAFGASNDQQQSNLEEIGKEIAKKCYGSPFAAVALGDILRIKLSLNDWNFVLKSDILVLTGHDVEPFMKLSYHYLSDPLKRCFAYCSIFPKKFIIEKKLLVQLWIAEGLVETSTDQEKVGEEYFDVLVSRSLIHRRSIVDEEANFEMHGFVHDFATEVLSSYCINMDEHELHDRVHNLSYNRGIYDSYAKFDKLNGLKGLRTFLALPLQEKLPLCFLSNKVVHDLLPTMKQLRVLSLSNYKSITEVPNSIGDLLYLQYLNLSHTKIERLPTETCKLYNLQFLLLAGCRRLIELPEDIGQLVNLRHLDVSDTALREMPVQIAKLENLQTLSNFVVSKHNHGLKLVELGKFPHLHGKLSMTHCPLLEASLRKKKGKEWRKIAHIPSIIIDGELIT
ncbi:putative disease resistance RPP13 protein [Trifolium repens]|nr:putative disease resistance RPP13 protein [Trifolium repens]